MEQEVNILHISDLHFVKENENKNNIVIYRLIEHLEQLQEKWKPNMIVVTGDITDIGLVEGYSAAVVWFRLLCEKMNIDTNNIFICPGNHDLDRAKAEEIDITKQIKLKSKSCNNIKIVDDILKDPEKYKLDEIFKNYSEFIKEMKVNNYNFGDEKNRLWGCASNQGINLIGLNTAWFCSSENDTGKLTAGRPIIKKIIKYLEERNIQDSINICYFHHTLRELFEEEEFKYAEEETLIQILSDKTDLILAGHVHAHKCSMTKYLNKVYFNLGGTCNKFTNTNHCSILKINKVKRCIERTVLETDSQGNWKSEYSYEKVEIDGRVHVDSDMIYNSNVILRYDGIGTYRNYIDSYLEKVDVEDLDILIKEFLENNSWKSKLKLLLEKLISSIGVNQSREREVLNKILILSEGNNYEYELIRSKVEDDLKLLRKSNIIHEKKNRDIYRKVKKLCCDGFSNFLFISGSMGSGKSYALSRMCKTIKLSSKKEIYVNLSVNDLKEVLNGNKDIIYYINRSIDNNFKDMQEMYEFNTKLEEKEKLLIVFVIDNIDNIFITEENNIYINFITIVKKLSKYDFLKWIATINTYNLFYIMDDDGFVKKYGYQDKEYKFARGIVSLDEINHINRIGDLIVESNNVKKFEEYHNQKYISNNPLAACIYIQSLKKSTKNVNSIVRYPYEFSKFFAQFIDKKLGNGNYNYIKSYEKNYFIRKCINYITKIIISKNKFSMNFDEFKILNNEFTEVMECSGIIEMNLKDEEINLIPDSYWIYKLIEIENKSFESWNKKFTEYNYIYSKLVEEYIYYEKQFGSLENLINISEVWFNTNYRWIIYKCALNMDIEYGQRIIENVLLNISEYDYRFENMKELELKREMFLLIKLMESTECSLKKTCKLVNGFSDTIDRVGLVEFATRVISNKLMKENNTKKIEACINRFLKCKVVNINKSIGKAFAYRKFNDKEIKEESFLSSIIKYLKENIKEIMNTKDEIKNVGPQNKKHFIEFYLLESFRQLILRDKSNTMRIHDIFMSKNYYFFDEKISGILRSCLVNEYGNYYSNNINDNSYLVFRDKYIKVIEELCKNNQYKKVSKIIAFHYIINSVEQEPDKLEKVDLRMIEYLEIIRNSEEVNEFVTKNRDVFEFNLD